MVDVRGANRICRERHKRGESNVERSDDTKARRELSVCVSEGKRVQAYCLILGLAQFDAGVCLCVCVCWLCACVSLTLCAGILTLLGPTRNVTSLRRELLT